MRVATTNDSNHGRAGDAAAYDGGRAELLARANEEDDEPEAADGTDEASGSGRTRASASRGHGTGEPRAARSTGRSARSGSTDTDSRGGTRGTSQRNGRGKAAAQPRGNAKAKSRPRGGAKTRPQGKAASRPHGKAKGRAKARVRATHPLWRVAGTLLARLCALFALASVVLRLLPQSMQQTPYVPIAISATPWFALAALAAGLLALIARRKGTLMVAIVCIAAQVVWQAPFLSGGGGVPGADLRTVQAGKSTTDDALARVMTLNVYKGRADAAAIVSLVRDEHVEVLAMQETTDDFVQRLSQAGLDDILPYHHVASSDGAYGNGVWSATPLADPVDDEVGSSASFMPAGTVAFPGKQVRFVSVHTTAPVSGYWDLWNRSLDEIAALQSRKDTIYVLMGDFNSTWDHAAFRNLLGSRFSDAARKAGSGLTLTWPADRMLTVGKGVWQRTADGGMLDPATGEETAAPTHGVKVPRLFGIDHIVLDRGIEAGDMEVREVAGSDHAALLGTIDVTEGAGQLD